MLIILVILPSRIWYLNFCNEKIMTDVEEYIAGFEADQKAIMEFFHLLLKTELNLLGKIRYQIPFYYQKSWICYLNPLKDGRIELAFLRGNELSDVQQLLSFNGRKQVAGIAFRSMEEIPVEKIMEIIHEALLLDTKIPYKSKRKK